MKTMSLRVLALPLVLFLGSFVMANETTKVLFDFSGTEPAKGWQTVNDGVMGGVSEGKFKIADAKTMESRQRRTSGSRSGCR